MRGADALNYADITQRNTLFAQYLYLNAFHDTALGPFAPLCQSRMMVVLERKTTLNVWRIVKQALAQQQGGGARKGVSGRKYPTRLYVIDCCHLLISTTFMAKS